MNKLTISAIKADVGSIGGHTCPSDAMIAVAERGLQSARGRGDIADFRVHSTGDDICLLMTHMKGCDSESIHGLAWNVFEAAN